MNRKWIRQRGKNESVPPYSIFANFTSCVCVLLCPENPAIKDALAEVVFDMEDDGKDVSTLDDAMAALEDVIDGINDAIDEIEDEELELDEEAEDEEEEDIEGGIVIDFTIRK